MFVGATEEHAFKDGEVPFYEPMLNASKCDGKLIGKREMCYRRGWWVDGMTENGTVKAKDLAAVEREQPSKWQANDIILRNEQAEDGEEEERVYSLYKVVEVPVAHKDRSSKTDTIKCQWLEQAAGDEDGVQAMSYKLTRPVYNFTADTLVWVKPSAVTVTEGKITNKQRCTIEFDMKDYLEAEKAAFHDVGNEPAAAEATGGGGADEGGDNDKDNFFGGDSEDEDSDEEEECDMTSLNAVLSRCPSFAEAKSMLEEIVEEAGHRVLLSSKYHCECAGQGIEYCFGSTCNWCAISHYVLHSMLYSQLLAFLHPILYDANYT